MTPSRSPLILIPLLTVLPACALQRELMDLRERTQIQEGEIARLEASVSEWRQRFEALEERRRGELATLREREGQIRLLQTSQSEAERLLSERVAELETELRTTEATLAGRDAEVTRLQSRELDMRADLSSTETALAALTTETEEIRRLLAQSEQETEAARQSEAVSHQAMGHLRAEIQDDLGARDEMIADLRARLLALQGTVANAGRFTDDELGRIETHVRETLETVEGPQPTFRRDPHRGLIITFAGDDLFEGRTTVVAETALQSLATLGHAVERLGDVHVTVVGHTDNEPVRRLPFRDNWQLSALRAENVLRALLEQGRVSPQRCTFAAAGEQAPLTSNATPEGRRTNRRVEIIAAPDRGS